MQPSLALPAPPRLPPVGLMPPTGDSVGALRRLVARYTPHGEGRAVLPPLAWREALAELAALHAEWQAAGRQPLHGPRSVAFAHLHRLEVFHEGACPRTGGPIVPLPLLHAATHAARHLPKDSSDE